MKKPPLFLRVISFFRPLMWRIVAVLILGIIGVVLFSMMPGYVAESIDGIENNKGLAFVIEQIIIYLSLALINEVFYIIAGFLIIKYEYKNTSNQISALKTKLDVVPISFLDKFEVGELSRRISLVPEVFKESLFVIYNIAQATFFFVTSLIAMLNMNVTLAFLVFMSLPLAILTARFVASKTQKYYQRNLKAEKEVYNFVEEHTTSHGLFVANGIDGKEEFAKANDPKGGVGEETAITFNTIYITFIQNFMYLAITVVFGMLMINGSISAAEFMILPAFLIYSQRFLSNATVVTAATNVMQRVKSRAGTFFEIMDYKEDVTADEDTNIKKIDGDIILENISTDSVKEVSLTIPFGSSVAFVGDTDTGSEIADLISKLSLPKSGQIYIGKYDLARIKSKSYYKRIGVAFEHPFIFTGSVAENIMYGVSKTLPENVIEVTSMFGFDTFIKSLPHSYETQLTENTVLLTSPEQQAITLSRTILQAPDVLILNNALCHYDILSERDYNDIIIKKIKKRTRIFVTKRIPSVKNVDQIFVCRAGRIVESGTHQELMDKKGLYYSLSKN